MVENSGCKDCDKMSALCGTEYEQCPTWITQFKGKYRFLSNFYPSPFEYAGNLYPTNEHFYQAMKTTDLHARVHIASEATPGGAKRLGRTVQLRSDWERIKVDVMLLGLKKKFDNPALAKQLIATYPYKLMEGNYWGDKYWGVCLRTNEGQNMLGKCLEMVREDVRRKQE